MFFDYEKDDDYYAIDQEDVLKIVMRDAEGTIEGSIKEFAEIMRDCLLFRTQFCNGLNGLEYDEEQQGADKRHLSYAETLRELLGKNEPREAAGDDPVVKAKGLYLDIIRSPIIEDEIADMEEVLEVIAQYKEDIEGTDVTENDEGELLEKQQMTEHLGLLEENGNTLLERLDTFKKEKLTFRKEPAPGSKSSLSSHSAAHSRSGSFGSRPNTHIIVPEWENVYGGKRIASTRGDISIQQADGSIRDFRISQLGDTDHDHGLFYERVWQRRILKRANESANALPTM